jgi:hypothetical protein
MKMHLFFEQSYTYLSGKLRCSTYATFFRALQPPLVAKFLHSVVEAEHRAVIAVACKEKSFWLQRRKVIAHRYGVRGRLRRNNAALFFHAPFMTACQTLRSLTSRFRGFT